MPTSSVITFTHSNYVIAHANYIYQFPFCFFSFKGKSIAIFAYDTSVKHNIRTYTYTKASVTCLMMNI